MRIAIILCCYNRKSMTKRCLTQLYNQMALFPNDTFKVYVCDDKSTDGTCEMIERDFSEVCLLKSGGNLYWCKSMYRGMKEAIKEDYDLYLMVNDDVDFFDDALQTMFDSYSKANRACAIVGATKSVAQDSISYGGRDKGGKLIIPDGTLKSCELANWNCFLINREVINGVGIIDGKYQHSWGDFDYSYRMNEKKYPIYLAVNYVGKCETNSINGTFRDIQIGKRKQLQHLFSVKGLPLYSYMRYHMRTQGKIGFFKYIYGYLSVIGYITLGKRLK